jgi:hypothetical protein
MIETAQTLADGFWQIKHRGVSSKDFFRSDVSEKA